MKRVVVLLIILSLLFVGCTSRNKEDIKDEINNKKETVNNVKISGSFIVTIRGIIPDYCFDDSTPSVAIVTLFQDKPFTVYLGEDLVSKVEVGKRYVFTIETKEIGTILKEKLKESILPIIALEEYKARVIDIRLAKDDEGGVVSTFLKYSVTE